MPRTDTNRGNPLTYVPGPPPAPGSTPEQIIRAVWDELHRIAAFVVQSAPSTTTNEGNHP